MTSKQSLTTAAALMGAIGGTRNTPAQQAARKQSIKTAQSARSSGKRKKQKCDHIKSRFANGHCRTCYNSWWYHQKNPDARYNDSSPLARFMSRVVETSSGCWLWTGSKKPPKQGGYPVQGITRNGKQTTVHAVAWAFEHIRGEKAPKRGEGLQVSHQPDRCQHMSKCCNPHHVEVETVAENHARIPKETVLKVCAKARAHRKPPRKKSHCVRGHLRTPENLSGHRCRTCMNAAVRERRYKARSAASGIENKGAAA
jgi:hypothetical protein